MQEDFAGIPAYEEYKMLVEKIFGSTSDWQRREQMKKTKNQYVLRINKGGSGKSTTCSNVGYGLRELGYKVLLIDGDMQLNLSLSLFDEDQVLAFAQS